MALIGTPTIFRKTRMVSGTAVTSVLNFFSRRMRFVLPTGVARGVMPPARVSRSIKRIVGWGLNDVGATKLKSRDRRMRLAMSHLAYIGVAANTTPALASFAGTAKLDNGQPLGDCTIRAIDTESGLEAARSSIDFVTGAYTLSGLVAGRACTLMVVNNIYNSTGRVIQFGPITA